ncbi:Carboxyl-terminal-processing protease [Triticum urartu]|uniref:Carboxyl-terminal-processing protease n=1 Tax=Triticum urartu TaxID=4572 RepID=M8AP58_TRIUA|nr:Carboxyl-terminal-processing protease [Triticum urartu]
MALAVVGAVIAGATSTTTRATALAAVTAGERKRRGALLSGVLRLGFLGQDDPREDGVEGQLLVAENDPDGVEALVEAVKELSAKIHLGDSMLDVGEAVGEEFHAPRVLGHGKITLLEVAILPVEDHEPGSTVGEEEILDLVPKGEGIGGADDVIHHRVGERGGDPENDMGIELKMERRGAEGGGAVGAKEKRGANCDLAEAKLLLKREGVVPKTNGGEEVEEEAEAVVAAGAVEKREPGEVNRVQRTLVEAWGLIRETFVDPTFNHQDWDQKLQQTMVEMFPLKSADAAYGKISGMVSTLGDPFTRIITPKVCMDKDHALAVWLQEYQSFRIGSDGNLQGVGIFINRDPASGRLLVMNCIEGGPADRAGIREGDELVEINGNSVLGLDVEAVAQRLRGRAGTTVEVKLLDILSYTLLSSSILTFSIFLYFLTDTQGTGNERSGRIKAKEVQLSREVINLSPLSTAIISHRSGDGHEGKTGYVRLAAFSQGGLVTAGLDVAQIWLDGDETLVNTVDREGNVQAINMVQGQSLTHDPLVVLVNEESASASEILAGALHDNGRAILSVTELDDGSALFITVAKYLSPALHEIDHVGIQPDIQCTADALSLPRAPSLTGNNEAASLEMDSCIMVAEQALEIQQSKGSAS